MIKNKISLHTHRLLLLTAILFGTVGLPDASAKQSVLYGGGPLYSNAATHRDMIRASGFTTIILWTIHVHSDGDLVLNDHKIVDNGVYVGRADWPAEVLAFKTGPTSVQRIEIAIGSWGVADFENIETLIDAQGTGPSSILYQNFKVIRDLIPAIDAVSYDDESNYDVDSSVALSLMLNDMGFKVTLCPYTRSSYWSSVYSTVQNLRPGAIDRIDLQCYAGGAWNNPGTWNNYFGGLRVTPGLWCYHLENNIPKGDSPIQVGDRLSSWNASYNIAGGFMWLLDDMLPHQGTYPVAAYANAINNALSIDPSANPVATLYQHCDYAGWTADFGVGAYTAADIITAGGQNNDASSLKVNPGWQITFYSEDNFQGSTLVKTSDTSCLVDDGWNDVVSSMEIWPITGPVAHWQFNDTGDEIAEDTTGYQFDGTLTNMDETNWVIGKQCGGLFFDGIDNYVEIDGFKGITGSSGRTCTAWIKTTKPAVQLLSWGTARPEAKWVIRTNEDGTLRAEVQGGYIYGTTSIIDGDWHHIAVTLDNDGSADISEALLYVDGRQETIGGVLSCPVRTTPSDNVKIGVYSGGLRYFEGLIDEVKVYSRMLDAAQIRDIYQSHALTADMEPDGDVDFDDFARLANNWQNPDACDGDLTCDCVVDFEDLMVFVEEWLKQITIE
jgi:hypothetical protein